MNENPDRPTSTVYMWPLGPSEDMVLCKLSGPTPKASSGYVQMFVNAYWKYGIYLTKRQAVAWAGEAR